MSRSKKAIGVAATCMLPLLTAWAYMASGTRSYAMLIGMMLTCQGVMVCAFYFLFKDRE